MNYKNIKDKGIKLLGVISIAFVSIVGTAPISTHALAPVSGDAILAQAKTYETNGWTYDSVGTCTGLVTRTLEALGIGNSIVGTMQGTMAKYNPTQMVDNANSHPADAKLIWKGYVRDIITAQNILKNGDLILQYPDDTAPNNGFGHAAFIEKVGGNIYAYGANNPSIGIGRLILLSASRGMETTVSPYNYIRVYRLAEEIKPIYQSINATKTASEDITVALTKTDVDSGKALEGVTFDFYRDNVKFGTTTTNSNGVASLLSSNNFSATSDNFTYAINYADLDANGRQEVANAGAYTNASEAQAAADAQAQAKANALANVSHTFKVVETATKAQYWLNPDNTTASNNQAGSGSVNLTLQNKRTVGTANLTKVDKDTSGAAQGTASLDGAVYGLYARENILDPADGSILTTKDSLIQQVTTVAAKASVSNLYLGEYYWKEITPSLGYQLDDTKYNVSISYANQATSTVVKDTTVQESIFTGEFEITKVIADDESGIATPEEGAEFIAVAKKYVDQYGGVEEAYTHKADFSAKEYELLRTNADGIAKSGKLAWGPYVVKQTKAAIDTDIMKDTFEFQVNSINQTLKKYIISNTPYKAYLKLVKKDATTGKAVTLSNATFKIFDIAKNKYVTQKVGNKTMSEFTTDETGATVLPLKLKNGDYRLEEIKAPNQYLISSTSIPFKITSSNVHEIDKDGDKIQSVEFANTPVLGTIEVTKTGEVLTGSKIDKDGNIDFVYETRNIPGMQVEILAKDDILDAADGSILFKKGSVVETMTTGVDGKIISSQIPLGNYIVKEVKAPNGFTLDTKEYDVSLKYKDDVTPIIEKSLTINDQRQKINAMILKQDFDTKTGLSGAKFGLYATEDIRGEDGSVLVTKDTLIETQISNEKGEVKFKADFPLTTYSIKEIAQPIGYATSNETLLLDGTYKDQTKETISYNEIFKNKITKLEVSKVDITTGKELPGNQLKVYEKENKGNVFDTWISDKTPHLIKGLEVGKTYVLKETSSAYGFALSKDIEFTIKDTGEIQKVKMENKLVEGKLSFTKTGNTFLNVKDNETEFGKMQSPVWNKENLIGSEIAIYAQEDIILGNDVTYFKKDEKVTTLASDLEPVTSESLSVGKYYYIETKAPAGYVKDNEKHLFEIKDNQKDELQIVSSSLNNERPNYELMFQKDLEANDIENKNAYKDVIFGLYAKKDILNAKGEIGITANTMIANLNIDEKGNLINFPILPVGTYYLKELQTNEAYILDEKEYDFTIQLSDEKDVPVMVNENKPIKNMLKDFKLVIQKLDSETKKNILNSDFEFSRYEDSKATKLIDTATTNKENGTATFDDLHYGITYIKESKAPVGYQLSKEIMKVEVKGDKVYINDKECTKVKEIDSVDYLNTLLPKINTGDNSTPVIFTFFGSISSIVLCSAFALKKRKEKIQAKAIKDLFESTKF